MALRRCGYTRSKNRPPIRKSITSLVDAANHFLETLRPELRNKYGFAFDEAYRKDWNNLPNFIHPRKGLRMGDLNPQERTARIA